MRKKLLAMLLCLTMLLSVFPATAFADEPDSLNEDVETVVEETETAAPEDMTAEPTDGEDAEAAEPTGEAAQETGEPATPPEGTGENPEGENADPGEVPPQNEPEDPEDAETGEDGEAPLPEDGDETEEEDLLPQSQFAGEIQTVNQPLGSVTWSLRTLDGGVFTPQTYADSILVVVGFSADASGYHDDLIRGLSQASWAKMDGVRVAAVSTDWEENAEETVRSYIQNLIPGDDALTVAVDGYRMVADLVRLVTDDASTFGFCAVIDGGAIRSYRTFCYDAGDVVETLTAYTGPEFLNAAPVIEMSLNVAYRSEEEIAAFMSAHPASAAASTYAVKPSRSEPYNPGQLSDASQQNAVNRINQIRYVAGLDADVVYDPQLGAYAQAGSFLNCLNNVLSHYPKRPGVLSASKYDSLVEMGKTGAKSSNIGMGYQNLDSAILTGWMADDDSSNIDRIGHRRWVLNPTMGATGFGHVGSYTAMYALDYSAAGGQTNVAWPAQNTPTKFFNASYPWNLSVGTELDTAETSVKLTRQSDGKVWNFSKAKHDGTFYVNNEWYGLPGCIIFRPKGLGSISTSDRYDVEVNTVMNGSRVHITYSVSFFSIHEHEGKLEGAVEATCTKEGYTGDLVCKVCGKLLMAGSVIEKLPHTPGTPTRVTLTEPTCTAEGSCTETVSCTVCGTVLSTEQAALPKASHQTETQNAARPTATESGYTGDEVCTVCGQTVREGAVIPSLQEAENMPALAAFSFDREYLLLRPGESTALRLTGLEEAWEPYLEWSLQDEAGNETDAVLSLGADGTITAAAYGTVFVTAAVTNLDGNRISARCRVDVLDEALQRNTDITASLPVPKVAVSLWSTDYTRVPVVLNLEQNLQIAGLPEDGENEERGETDPAEAGITIESAAFEDGAPAGSVFALRVADDRNLEIVPTVDVTDPASAGAVAGSYKSAIVLHLSNGAEVTTPTKLTVTVGKTLPKLSAKQVVLNGFVAGHTVPVAFSGGTVRAVEPVELSFAALNADGTVTLKDDAPKKAKQSVTAVCSVEGWTLPIKCKITVSSQYNAPKLSLKPASLTLNRRTVDSASAALAVTPVSGVTHEITARAPEGLTAQVDSLSGTVTVGLSSAETATGTYTVELLADGVPVKTMKVKVIDSAPSVSAKAAGAIDTDVKKSSVTITLSMKNCHFKAEDCSVSFLQKNGSGEATGADDLFAWSPDGSVIRVTGTDGLIGKVQGYTYTAVIQTPVGEKSVTLKVKSSGDRAPAPSVTLKAAGSIDILRGGTSITVTPTFKNWYDYDETKLGLRCENPDLEARWENGKFFVTAKRGVDVDPALKRAWLTYDGEDRSKPLKLNLKMGKAAVAQSGKTVTLSKNDCFDRQTVTLSLNDSTLNSIAGARVEQDEASKNTVQAIPLGNGEFAFGYPDGRIPAAVRSGARKSTTVKLKVWLQGNKSGKPNATVSVTVKFA